jgi:hypothetical protein
MPADPNTKSLYSDAHLFVAAIRVFQHLHRKPPTIEEVCDQISLSIEQGTLLFRKLTDIGALEGVEGSYGVRLFIIDHLKIETLPREKVDPRMQEELRKFHDSRKEFSKKIETMRAEQLEKKKSRFAEMEKKLKAELEKKQRKD